MLVESRDYLKHPVVVSRTDRLGDLILSLPVLGFLKQVGFSSIWLRVAEYTRDIAELAKANQLCERVLLENQELPLIERSQPKTGIFLVHRRAHWGIHKTLGLRFSLGPRTHLGSLFCYSKTVPQHRSRCEMSECEYNLELAKKFCMKLGISFSKDTYGLPPLKIPASWSAPLKAAPVVIVVGNGGSAMDLSLDQYIEIAHSYNTQPVDFLVAGPQFQQFKDKINSEHQRVVGAFASLKELSVYLGGAKKVIATSTGPLHLAHALGIPVLGFYPRKTPKTRAQVFRRWRPHGYWHKSPVEYIEFG
jgi:heptosyltransferase-3